MEGISAAELIEETIAHLHPSPAETVGLPDYASANKEPFDASALGEDSL
jgi:hypothetical protein